MGAIAVLAEMVGPTGRVVGVDFSEAAIGRARSIADALGLENVSLHAGDIHQLDPAAWAPRSTWPSAVCSWSISPIRSGR